MRIFLVLATFYSDENDRKIKLAEILTFETIFGTGIEFLGKIISEMFYFKKIERIFDDHFLTKMHIFAMNRHLKVVES